MNGKLFQATCLQCNERYEDYIYGVGNTSRHQRASKSNRNIWAASHCEKTAHVRFLIADVDQHVAILRSPGPHPDGALELDDLQLTIESDENYGTIRLGPGEVQG